MRSPIRHSNPSKRNKTRKVPCNQRKTACPPPPIVFILPMSRESADPGRLREPLPHFVSWFVGFRSSFQLSCEPTQNYPRRNDKSAREKQVPKWAWRMQADEVYSPCIDQLSPNYFCFVANSCSRDPATTNIWLQETNFLAFYSQLLTNPNLLFFFLLFNRKKIISALEVIRIQTWRWFQSASTALQW